MDQRTRAAAMALAALGVCSQHSMEAAHRAEVEGLLTRIKELKKENEWLERECDIHRKRVNRLKDFIEEETGNYFIGFYDEDTDDDEPGVIIVPLSTARGG